MLMGIKVDSQQKHRLCGERKELIKAEYVGRGNRQMVSERYHCIMVRSFDVILGTTAPCDFSSHIWTLSLVRPFSFRAF